MSNSTKTEDEVQAELDDLARYVLGMLREREGQHPGFLCWNDEVQIMGACISFTGDNDESFVQEILGSLHTNMYDYLPDEDGGMEFLEGRLEDKGCVVVVAVRDGRHMEPNEVREYLETGPKVESQTYAHFGFPPSWQLVYPQPEGCPRVEGCPNAG